MRSALVAVVSAASVVAACSGDDDPIIDAGSVTTPSVTASGSSAPGGGDGDDIDDVFTETDTGSVADLGPVPPAPPTQGTVSDSVLDPIEPVPETGVPGIESDDGFCRSWSEFAGSYQALTFAWAVRGGLEAARLEVVATDALSSAATGLAEGLPPELESERQALTVDLTSPILRRAQSARDALVAAGADEATIRRLGDAWLDAVAESGLEAEDLQVAVEDPTTDAVVDDAAAILFGELPPIVEDPSLIVDVQIPATEAYLFENCPDKGILAGNDNVDL